MDRLIDSQSSAMDDNAPIEEWVQTLVAERPQWAREEGRRRDEEAMAKARALWEATGTLEGLSKKEWFCVMGVLCPEEVREALLHALAGSSLEGRARILLQHGSRGKTKPVALLSGTGRDTAARPIPISGQILPPRSQMPLAADTAVRE